eukprot:g31938.t1
MHPNLDLTSTVFVSPLGCAVKVCQPFCFSQGSRFDMSSNPDDADADQSALLMTSDEGLEISRTSSQVAQPGETPGQPTDTLKNRAAAATKKPDMTIDEIDDLEIGHQAADNDFQSFRAAVRNRLRAPDFALLEEKRVKNGNKTLLKHLHDVVGAHGNEYEWEWGKIQVADLQVLKPNKAAEIARLLRGNSDLEGYKTLQRLVTAVGLTGANLLWKFPGLFKFDLTFFTLRNETKTDFMVAVKYGCKGGGIYHTPFFEQDLSGIDVNHFLLEAGEEKVFSTASPPDGCTITISGFLLVLGKQRPIIPGCFVIREKEHQGKKLLSVSSLRKNWKLRTWAPSFKHADWTADELEGYVQEAGIPKELCEGLIKKGYTNRGKLKDLRESDLVELKATTQQTDFLLKFAQWPLQGTDKLVWVGPAPTPEAATPQYYRVLKPKAHLTEWVGKLPEEVRVLSQSDDVYRADSRKVVELSEKDRRDWEEAEKKRDPSLVFPSYKEIKVILPTELEEQKQARELRISQGEPRQSVTTDGKKEARDFKIFNGELTASLNCWMWCMHSLSHTWAFLNKPFFMDQSNLLYEHEVRPMHTEDGFIPIDHKFLVACTDSTIDTAYELPQPDPEPKLGELPDRPLQRVELQWKDLSAELIITRAFTRLLDVYNEYGLLIIQYVDGARAGQEPHWHSMVLLFVSAFITGMANGSRSAMPPIQGRYWFGDGEDWIDEPSAERRRLPDQDLNEAEKYYKRHGGGYIGMTQYTDAMLRHNLPLLLTAFTQIFVLKPKNVKDTYQNQIVWCVAQVYLGIVTWSVMCTIHANAWRDKGYLPCTPCAPKIGRTR